MPAMSSHAEISVEPTRLALECAPVGSSVVPSLRERDQGGRAHAGLLQQSHRGNADRCGAATGAP